jgi:peptide/nickel transport system permease protein
VKSRLRYLGRRLGWALVLVFGVTSLSFIVSQLLPGDPARIMLGPQAAPADVARAREIYGFDRSIAVQYGRYWSRLVHRGPPAIDRMERARDPAHRSCKSVGLGIHVDLGYSFNFRRPVIDLLLTRAPRSIELAFAALLIQVMIGVTLGMVAAARRGTAWDEAAMGAALIGLSAPTFLLGLVLRYLFAYKLMWLPFDGYGSTFTEHLRSLVLPALTLGIFGSALYARLTRDELGALLAQDFVRTARAKGASGGRVLFVHALRNALVPLATVLALDLGALVGGAVVTERLFLWPGLGQLSVDAVLNRDGPVIFGTVLFSSLVVVASTLVLDLAYVLLDPRLGQRSGP